MEDGQLNRIVVIVQARMQSTRLPGKVLMPLPFGDKESILGRIVSQLKLSEFKPKIIIATSQNADNDAVDKFASAVNVGCFRGDEDDVFSRFYSILTENVFDYVVRITADNPLLDILIMDYAIKNHIQSRLDYSCTNGLPIGMNFEVFNVESFLRMSTMMLSGEDREHVTIKFKTSNVFKCNTISIDTGIAIPIRVTVDYPNDYLMVSALFEISQNDSIPIGLELVKHAIQKYPWIFTINEMNFQKKVYSSLEEEIIEVIPVLKNLELNRLISYLKKC